MAADDFSTPQTTEALNKHNVRRSALVVTRNTPITQGEVSIMDLNDETQFIEMRNFIDTMAKGCHIIRVEIVEKYYA